MSVMPQPTNQAMAAVGILFHAGAMPNPKTVPPSSAGPYARLLRVDVGADRDHRAARLMPCDHHAIDVFLLEPVSAGLSLAA